MCSGIVFPIITFNYVMLNTRWALKHVLSNFHNLPVHLKLQS